MPGRDDEDRLNMPENKCDFTECTYLKRLFASEQLFGCDGVLHSRKVRDVCGVCGGDGSSCMLISDSYTGGQAKGSKPQYSYCAHSLAES